MPTSANQVGWCAPQDSAMSYSCNLVSLGANCHPAYWLRRHRLSQQAGPFDWLLSPSDVGLEYVAQMSETRFEHFLSDVCLNERGHPVASGYPHTEFFHHHNLLASDPEARRAERDKLARRAQRFLNICSGGKVKFLYCFDVDNLLEATLDESRFHESIDRLLQIWPQARLHLYFLSDFGIFPELRAPHNADRVRLFCYHRDKTLHEIWGQEPYFLRKIVGPVYWVKRIYAAARRRGGQMLKRY